VDLFVKPERIRVVAAGAGLGAEPLNQLQGRLRDVIFKGPYVDCLVELASGAELTVSAPPDTPGLARGAAVGIGWGADAAAVFPAAGA
jgi:ABC-type Fe3+/spermidine/putrescine transport system ATPase subunit